MIISSTNVSLFCFLTANFSNSRTHSTLRIKHATRKKVKATTQQNHVTSQWSAAEISGEKQKQSRTRLHLGTCYLTTLNNNRETKFTRHVSFLANFTVQCCSYMTRFVLIVYNRWQINFDKGDYHVLSVFNNFWSILTCMM